jgi:vitamin B12 transporter
VHQYLSYFAFLSVIGLTSTNQALAETTLTADEIVVTATRIPTPELEVASSITVITAGEIEAHQLRSLPAVLNDVPGLNVVQSGGPGAQTSVFMRGTNSNHTKVLVDGIDVSDPSSPTGLFDFGQLSSQDFERVEVLRGPQSGLYGSDAIGGVINVITRSGSGPLGGFVRVEGGSFDTFNQSAGLGGSSDGFHYTANVDHFHSAATPVTPLDLLVAGERRIDDYYDNLTLSTKLGQDIGSNLDVGLVGRYTDSHLHNTAENYAFFPNDVPDSAQSQSIAHQSYTRGKVHGTLFDGIFDQTLGLAYSDVRSLQRSPDGPPAEYAGARFKIDWQGNVKLTAGQILILGAEHEKNSISQPIAAATAIESGYAELQSGWNGRLFNTVSVRYDANDHFGSKATFRVAPAYLITQTGTKLKASVGSGFKAPTLSELFQNFPGYGFYGNPRLRPESSTGYEVGVEQQLPDSLAVGVTYYHNDIKNLIDSAFISATVMSYVNVGRAVTQGVESFISWQAMPSLKLRADYTFTQADDEILNEELLRRPKHKATLSAEWWATEHLSVAPSLRYVGRWIDGNRDFSISRLTAASYSVADVAIDYALNARLSLFGRVDNLGGRHYENPVGFLQPARGVYAGVKASF